MSTCAPFAGGSVAGRRGGPAGAAWRRWGGVEAPTLPHHPTNSAQLSQQFLPSAIFHRALGAGAARLAPARSLLRRRLLRRRWKQLARRDAELDRLPLHLG